MKSCKMILLFFIVLSCASEPRKRQAPTGSHLIGGKFTMKNHDGISVTEKDFFGKYTMVFFGFTSCPSVCPMGLSRIGTALNRLPKDIQSEIQPIFVTVDPQRDTEAVIKKYVKIYNRNFIGLRGTLVETQEMVKKYRGYYKKVYEDESKDYLMDHSDIIYFMDKDGKYLAHFGSATPVSQITSRVKEIIQSK